MRHIPHSADGFSTQNLTGPNSRVFATKEMETPSAGPHRHRASLGGAFCLFTAIGVSLVAGVLISFAARKSHLQLLATKTSACQGLANALARTAENQIAEGKLANSRHLINRVMESDGSVIAAHISDADNHCLVSRERTSSDSPDSSEFKYRDLATAQNIIVVESPMFDSSGANVGRVVLAFSLHAENQESRHLLLSLTLLAGACGFGCLAIAMWLSRRLTCVIEQLIAGAGRLSRFDFDIRLTKTPLKELAHLSDSFNSLANVLSEAIVSRNYVNSILDSMLEGLVIVDSQLRIMAVNPAFRRLADRRSEDLIGASLVQLLMEEDGRPLEMDLESTEAPTAFVRDCLIKRADGREIPVCISCTQRKSAEQNGTEYVIVVKNIEEAKAAQSEMQRLANLDPLTGTLNRRAFVQQWKNQAASSKQETAVIVMTDVDYFKRINDVFGHSAGDEVLANIGKILQQEVGENGLVCRYGGEEFCIGLFNQTEEDAAEWADCLRLRIEASRHAVGQHRLQVTCTFGLASEMRENIDIDDLVDRADHVLAYTKERGRNRVGTERQLAGLPAPRKRHSIAVKNLLQPVTTICLDAAIADAWRVFATERKDWLVVVDQNGEYFGCLSRVAVEYHGTQPDSTSIGEIADTSIPTFEPEMPIEMIAAFVNRCQPPLIVVLSNVNGNGPASPLGIVPAAALLHTLEPRRTPVLPRMSSSHESSYAHA